ncbi:hypothetical protein QVD99_001682 [Batrachochytrium dendrobatidis]|nr:hypothetical protein QVD99_001682 [Batrachochytrium dendrobatidis]
MATYRPPPVSILERVESTPASAINTAATETSIATNDATLSHLPLLQPRTLPFLQPPLQSPKSNAFQARQTALLLLAIIPEALFDALLIPLYPFVVKHLLPDESNIGQYVGLMASSFYLPLFVMNLVWGGISDRYGRKPVLIIGLVACLVTTLGIGLSQSFWLTITFRFIAGVFGANSTVAKGMLGDISSDDASRSTAYALYGSIYGISGIVGPIIGGILADPATVYPDLFGNNHFLKEFPFILPSLLGAGLTCVSLLTTIVMLNEQYGSKLSYSTVETTDDATDLYNNRVSIDSITNDLRLDQQNDHAGADVILLNDSLGVTISAGGTMRLARRKMSMIGMHSEASLKGLTHHLDDDSYMSDGHASSISAAYLPVDTSEMSHHSNVHQRSGSTRRHDDETSDENTDNTHFIYPPCQPISHPEPFVLLSRKTLSPIILYCAIALTNSMYVTSLPLFLSAPRSTAIIQSTPHHINGTGAGLNSRDTSFYLTAIYAAKLSTQLILFHHIKRIFTTWGKSRGSFLAAMMLLIPTQLLVPLVTVFVQGLKETDPIPASFSLALIGIMAMFGLAEATAYISVIVMITESAAGSGALGLAHGFASTMAACMRTVGPSIIGWMWEVGGTPWVVFIGSACVALFGVVAAWFA